MSQGLIKHFFAEASSLSEKITSEELEAIITTFPEPSGRRDCRLAVELQSIITNIETGDKISGTIKDVSRSGFLVAENVLHRFTSNARIIAEIALPDEGILTVSGRTMWMSEQHGAGFRVDNNHIKWLKFIRSLEAQLPNSDQVRRSLKTKKKAA